MTTSKLRDTDSGWAYDGDGRLLDITLPAFECNAFCGCGDECSNRVGFLLHVAP